MPAKNRNLFRVTRWLILNLPPFFKFLATFRVAEKKLLLLKTDAIGDYILFRNFIEIVKKSEKFKEYKVHLLGNPLWRDIALKYDHEFVDVFFFINMEECYVSPLKTIKLAWRLFTNNYSDVLQPTYSRTFIADGLAAFTAAKQITGFEGSTERIQPKYKAKTDRFYTQLLKLPESNCFEFDRSVFFFENVLKQPVFLKRPSITFEEKTVAGIVIFPGSGVLKRNWEPEKFLALSRLILANTSQPIYIAGGHNEIELGRYLAENLQSHRVYNLAGKTSLTDLIDLIGNAALVISNETSVVHIAAAAKVKTVCILGGGHFGRFAPYPGGPASNLYCIYEKMDCYNCNWNCIFPSDERSPYPCMSAISVEQVWQQTARLLKETGV